MTRVAHVWMNRHDVENAVHRIDASRMPNLARGARILQRLVDWTDSNSDGWTTWPQPSRAANRLMLAIQHVADEYRRTGAARDITEAELRAVLSPIKTFLTRRNVDHGSILNDPPPHNIDVFRSGGGSDGEPRYLPACLTCMHGVGPVCWDYGVALALATAHRDEQR